MNFSESAKNEQGREALLHSLQQWWKDAGVDADYLEVPGPLLGKSGPVSRNSDPVSEIPAATPAAVTVNAVTTASENDSLPDTLEAFLQWLKETPNVAGQQDASGAVCPYGPADPDMMIVIAMPDQNRSDPAKIFNQSTGLLVNNMLRAVNVDPESTFFSCLSLTRPIEGRIDQALYPALTHRMLKLVELVNPKKIILFGDTATRALCNEELLVARKKKLFINQGPSKTEAIATFHPGILIERPEIKAEAWQDLQPLLGTV